jgi:hypothetical protein
LDRNEVDENFQDLDEAARWLKYRTEKQIHKRASNLLLQQHHPLIHPEYTNTAYVPGLVGEETGRQGERCKATNAVINAKWNPINNPINGPINGPIYGPIAGARIKEENRAARDEFFRTKFPDQIDVLVTPKQAEVHRQRILDTKYPDLGDLSIQDFLRTYPNAGLYVGMTGQILEREDLRWLTERDNNNNSKIT